MAAAVQDSGLAIQCAPTNDEVWVHIARGYAEFSCPLVPSAQDIRVYERAAARHAADRHQDHFDALILGVTPGIANMNWPARSRILAVERSPTVIRALWPGDVRGVREVRCASWFDVPAERSSFDLVVGDGSLNTCGFPDEIGTLCSEICALLRPGGIFAVRAYVQPVVAESIEAIFDALLSAPGLRVDEFKMRLFLSMQRSSQQGVAVREAARVLHAFRVDRTVMKERLGWTEAAVAPFDKWQSSNVVYSFPSLSELRTILLRQFEEDSITFPTYPIGDCCPVIVMRSRRLEVEQGSV
jgi:hypothetical protein